MGATCACCCRGVAALGPLRGEGWGAERIIMPPGGWNGGTLSSVTSVRAPRGPARLRVWRGGASGTAPREWQLSCDTGAAASQTRVGRGPGRRHQSSRTPQDTQCPFSRSPRRKRGLWGETAGSRRKSVVTEVGEGCRQLPVVGAVAVSHLDASGAGEAGAQCPTLPEGQNLRFTEKAAKCS